MKTSRFVHFLFITSSLFAFGCAKQANDQPIAVEENVAGGGQSTVQDSESQKNVVQVAIASPSHSTLVAAVKAGELVDALSNAGPFTVFAPTNDAFNKLPAGTVEDLLKPENKEKLQDILQFHVAVGVYKTENIKDGQVLGMVNGGNVTFGISGEKVTINGANITATVAASNGVVYVVDQVLLPK